ncbi:MAG: 30S ribosomal protein THX [Bacteroidales bacterium]|nr:30S ribosomal protein THX [Bacteroidales bacterium]
MGKGDMKTAKGKRFRKSYGVRRPRKKTQMKKKALEKNPQDNAPELKEKMSEVKAEEKEKKKETSGSKSKGGSSKKKETREE